MDELTFTRDELEHWLYAIKMNNLDTDFDRYITEIINRLDGFERFVIEKREDDDRYCGGY